MTMKTRNPEKSVNIARPETVSGAIDVCSPTSATKINQAVVTEQAEHPVATAETAPGKTEVNASLDMKKADKGPDNHNLDNQETNQEMIRCAGTMKIAEETSVPSNICP